MQDNAQVRMSVSVIIPTYNRVGFIANAIESAMNQSRPPDQIVVVDDGSTDDTDRVLRKIEGPVLAIRQSNRGVAAARNRALRAATGDAIVFLDSDDLLLPSCIERCTRALEDDPRIDVVHGDAYLVDRAGNRIGTSSALLFGRQPSGMILGDLGCKCTVRLSSATVRRSALAGAVFDEGLVCAEDYDFWRQLAARCRFHYVDEPLACYRYHESQLTATQSVRLMDDTLEVQRRILEMPEFAQVPPRQRARAFCSFGARNAVRGRMNVAQRMFWRAIWSSPGYPIGYLLAMLGLLGNRPLRYAILKRRDILGRNFDIQARERSDPNRQAAPVSLTPVCDR
jgi:Glycosyl transferase family 2